MTALDVARQAEPGRTAEDILSDLDAGRRRAARPDPSTPEGWRIDEDVRSAILERFRDRANREWAIEDVLRFRDRAGLPTKVLSDPSWRVVPGGSSIRAGVFLGPGVVVMPPSFVNVGAWVGAGTMIDSHVLVGSCAQIGARVHLAAGVIVGGVLEPAGARPVIVEDDAFVGAGAQLLEGVLVRTGAVIGAGVSLTGTSRLYDLVDERVHTGTPERPLVVPAGAVVVPGSRALTGDFAVAHGLAASVALVVKRRDDRTDARTALEEALR
ncbi:MAG TPA: 2,3,4,5-tetrahydropyridine-2,6-dicarboxylate N-succinyltransferase [Candidatus Limnocylindrales bacterium]|nr:2,3,4,5-tetrahydropyridine-2,6-dicarboxylate N-succinyltransferase [Candidatus Limnocylindrales bacterium]